VIELRRAGDELVLDAYNYRGPAKTFWEQASQAGAFFKGNVRNAVIVEVAAKSEFVDFDAFRRHIAAASVADSVDDEFAREIVYASGGSALSLRYSLWDMSVIERKRDGVPYTPPMGRAGATDGTGAQWIQSRDALIELGGAKLMAGRTPKWLFADADSRRWVFVNPSDDAAPVWLETANSTVECEEFAFGRIELDEANGVISIECEDEIAPLRLRAASSMRLILNGNDVSASLRPSVFGDGAMEFAGI
jgi:hypothetical protein